MVNSISTSNFKGPDTGKRIAVGTTPAPAPIPTAHVKTDLPEGGAEAPALKTVSKPAAPPVAPVPALSTAALAPPLTSLALFKDAESGMQVAIVRDKMSGDIVEQVPTERARRLAAMLRQQETVAQNLRQDGGETPHIDVKT